MDWKTLHHARAIPENPKASVLVVEDESIVRDLWQGWLMALGYEVQMAEDAHQALPLLKQQQLYVAVCDVHLPGPSGLWLADQIRTISPTTAVVLATGDRAIPANESLRPGIVAYLVKPFLVDDLKDAVQAGIRWSAMQRTK